MIIPEKIIIHFLNKLCAKKEKNDRKKESRKSGKNG